MNTFRCRAVLVVSAVLLAGCGAESDTSDGAGSGTSGPTPVTADAVSIDGSWVLRSGALDGEPMGSVDGRNVTMDLDVDRIDGTAACNSYGGTVTVGGEPARAGSFTLGELSWTEMGCDPAVMAVEQQFLDALRRVDAFELTDTRSLDLTGGDTVLRFDRVTPVDDHALVGTTWRLDTVISGDTASNSTAMDAAFVEFLIDGTLVGSTGCRRLQGTWSLQGTTLQIPTLSATEDPTAGVCAPEAEALDGEVVALLESGANVEIDGGRLTLTTPDGDGLSFFAE